ncbi:hypothetical protein E2C01_020490 [Portunus trituberculatus]|uniref:Uncharacterized protein n=1 Tax=Portunus trituberculatus TaxID=210409 RepID=A0A5B7DZW8_PORTR|nr:hypothetical protein [Portunus trituberculatus]
MRECRASFEYEIKHRGVSLAPPPSLPSSLIPPVLPPASLPRHALSPQSSHQRGSNFTFKAPS